MTLEETLAAEERLGEEELERERGQTSPVTLTGARERERERKEERNGALLSRSQAYTGSGHACGGQRVGRGASAVNKREREGERERERERGRERVTRVR